MNGYSRPDHSCLNCRSGGSGWLVATVIVGDRKSHVPHASARGKFCRNCAVRAARSLEAVQAQALTALIGQRN